MASSNFDGILLGMENPHFGVFLNKYDIKLNNVILTEDNNLPMYDEMSQKFIVEYIAGVLPRTQSKWPRATSYMGSTGKDKYEEAMKKDATTTGFNVQYYKDESTPIETCGVCILGGERSLIANLSAAN